MSRKLLIAIAVMSVAVAGTAFAAVENIKVSGDINTQGVTRDLSLGGDVSDSATYDPLDAEDFIFSQVRVRFDADLTEGVSAVVRLLNERYWGADSTSTSSEEIQLDLAYIDLKEFYYEPLTLIVGRQNLRYGNALIVGDPDTNQVALTSVAQFGDLSAKKAFDSVRAILDYSPYTIDIIYAKIDENSMNVRDDETLWGVNAAYEWNSYNGVTEGYIFYRDGTNNTQDVENEDYVLTIGARAQFDPNDNWTLGVEGAHQLGDYITGTTTYQRDAWAAQVTADYRFLNDYNAKIGVTYTWLTGEASSPEKNEYNAWDPMYEDQSLGELANIFLASSNVQCWTLSGSMMPREDLTLGALYLFANAVEDNLDGSDFVGATGGPIAGNTYLTKKDEKNLAQEVDVYALLDYTEDVQINLNTAFLMPGALFDNQNEQLAYSVRLGMKVSF